MEMPVDVILNKWATVVQISVLLTMFVIFTLLWFKFPRKVVYYWMASWSMNVLALVAIYIMLLGDGVISEQGLKGVHLVYSFCKISFAVLFFQGFSFFLREKKLLNPFQLKAIVAVGLVILGSMFLFSFVSSLHIQLFVYFVIGVVFLLGALYPYVAKHTQKSYGLQYVFALEGIVFLHHGFVMIPTLWGESMPTYMTRVSFFDSISELIVGTACLFALAMKLVDEIKQQNAQMDEAQIKLRELVDADPLTGLWNRRKLEDFISSLKSDAYLLYIDVNDFKHINDEWGHHIGDLCLEKVARVLKQVFPKSSGLFRVGGDEFLVVYVESDNVIIPHFCRRLVSRLAQEDEQTPSVSVSIGQSTISKDMPFSKALELADRNMYAEKSALKSASKSSTIRSISRQ